MQKLHKKSVFYKLILKIYKHPEAINYSKRKKENFLKYIGYFIAQYREHLEENPTKPIDFDRLAKVIEEFEQKVIERYRLTHNTDKKLSNMFL